MTVSSSSPRACTSSTIARIASSTASNVARSARSDRSIPERSEAVTGGSDRIHPGLPRTSFRMRSEDTGIGTSRNAPRYLGAGIHGWCGADGVNIMKYGSPAGRPRRNARAWAANRSVA